MLWLICVLQLRRSAGDLLGVSAARARDEPHARAARRARIRVRVGLRALARRSPAWSSIASGGRPRSSAAFMRGASSAWRRRCRTNFRHLVFWRAAEGLGETFYFPASMSLISDYHDRGTRSRAMGLHQTSVYVGTIGGGFFAGLIGQYYGWRLSFIVFGGLGVLLGFVLNRYPDRAATRRGGSRGRERDRRPAPAQGPKLSFTRLPAAGRLGRRPCSASWAPSCARTSSPSSCCRGCRSFSTTSSAWAWRWPA